MAYSTTQQKKHRGLGGGGMNPEIEKELEDNHSKAEPLHNGYMREGDPSKEESTDDSQLHELIA